MKVLYVEGNERLAKSLMKRLWCWVGARWRVQRVPNSSEAIDYLSGFQMYSERTRFPFPDIVFLSLSAQTRHGFDLLAWLRGERLFLDLPVIVLSTARSSKSALCARELAPVAWFAQIADLQKLLPSLLRLRPRMIGQPQWGLGAEFGAVGRSVQGLCAGALAGR
jgi:DNA-binding response OmpR family regulator